MLPFSTKSPPIANPCVRESYENQIVIKNYKANRLNIIFYFPNKIKRLSFSFYGTAYASATVLCNGFSGS
jgi:hypothetical protein